jgi:hypothetical protein
MSKRSLAVRTLTPTATADAANLVNDTYLGVIQGGDTLQRNEISEIMLGGQAGASAPTIVVAGMNSTIGTSIVVGISEDAPLDGASGALANPAAAGVSATIAPQRSATLGHLLQLSFNAFGGIVRWLAAPGEEIAITGLLTDTGSFSLSAFTGGTPGLMSSHIVYESL